MMIQTLPFTNSNAVYRATINITSGGLAYDGIGLIAVSQSSGTSQTSVMSQRAVTEAVKKTSLYVKFTITPETARCNYSFATISEYIGNSVVYCDVTFTSTGKRVYCYLYSNEASAITFRGLASYNATSSFDITLTSGDSISYNEPTLGYISHYPHFVISSNGETIPAAQLTILQNILNAIVVNKYSPQIYLNITTDNVTEQLYVDSANSAGYVLRNNNYIITYTTTPSATIEPVEKVFNSSVTGVTRIAAGPETGYNILKIIGTDVDLTNYYIVDADITNLIGGVTTLISVSSVSGVPVILLYSNGIAFSGSWTVTCRHK